jgi:hypothetical protein
MGDSMSTIINATTTNGVVIQPDNSGSLVLQTNSGTTALTIDTSQNVGIGTTSPAYKIDVQSSSDVISNIQSIGTIQSAMVRLVGRASSVDKEWNIVATGSGLGADALRFVRGGWTGTPSMSIDSNDNLLFNSGYGSAGIAYGCRVWVNFNGTGTVAIRASGNVTSITDNGTGNYTVNFTTAMPNANYGVNTTTGDSGNPGNQGRVSEAQEMATTSVRVRTYSATAVLTDQSFVGVSIFR